MDAIAAGYWSPQWTTHFCGGLGEPYFGYYQPGLFYAVAAFGSVLPVTKAIAAAVWAYAVLGYAGTFALVRARFGTTAGVLAGTMLLATRYVRSDLYVRGDLSEFAGMMTLAATLAALVGWLERGGWSRWVGLAVGAALVVVTHPVAGLLGYALLGGTIVVWALAARSIERPLGATLALVAGVGLAAFYWMPLLLEWHYVSGNRAAAGPYAVSRNFVPLLAFFGLSTSPAHVQVAIGKSAVLLAGLATLVIAWRWRQLTAAHRRLVIVLWAIVIVSTLITTDLSEPLWVSLPLVGLVQFPWRAIMIQAIALSALAGCLPGVHRCLLVVGAIAVAWPLADFWRPRVVLYDHAETATDLEQLVVAPDAVHEWLPATARLIKPPRQWREPTITTGTVTGFERRTGSLRVRVDAPSLAVVTLPHYYFPIGWQATYAEHPVALRPAYDGLMTAWVLGRGVLEARFFTTPARRTGWLVSGATALLVAAGVVGWRRRRAVPG
jgi:hypothetical protein